MINVKAVKKLMGQNKWDIFVKGPDAIACMNDNTMMFRLSAQEAIELKSRKVSIVIDEDQYVKKERIFEQVVNNNKDSACTIKDTCLLLDCEDCEDNLLRVLQGPDNNRLVFVESTRYKLGLYISEKFITTHNCPLLGLSDLPGEPVNCLIAPRLDEEAAEYMSKIAHEIISCEGAVKK